MGRALNYTNLLASLLLVFLFSVNLGAQSWTLVDSIATLTPSSVAVDLSGRIYFSTSEGGILQFSEAGDSLRAFQPSGQEPPDLFTWQMLRTQAYFPFQQSLLIIDQNLNEVSHVTLPETVLGNAFLGADQHVWYVNSERLLIKYNPVLDQTVLSTSLQWYLQPSSIILSLHEYQNRLYIQFSQQVIILDLYGNYLSKLSIETEKPVRFLKNNLYFTDSEKIELVGLYDNEIKEMLLPNNVSPDHLLLTENFLHIFRNNYWYRYQKQTLP
ncbi:MAG: hypothetical protein ACFB15_04255 [Cyclobacteriaceae bacterium]